MIFVNILLGHKMQARLFSENKYFIILNPDALSLQVQFIKNQAAEISQDATAQASLIAAISQANYTAALEQARTEGLKNVFNALGFTQQNQKNSFDYLRTVRGLEKMHITVDYQQKIAGNLA